MCEILWAHSKSSSEVSEHSEESGIRSLTDLEQYIACSETTALINQSTLLSANVWIFTQELVCLHVAVGQRFRSTSPDLRIFA